MKPSMKNQFRPAVEGLEDRMLLSWGSTPPAWVNLSAAGNDRSTISFQRNGNYAVVSQITRNEIDYRTFTPHRTGQYTFTAGSNSGSRIDTVAALYDVGGNRIAYNDDANGTRNSQFTTRLVAGRTYVFGVTNFSGSPNGTYEARIAAPSLYVEASTGRGVYYCTEGSATLSGTNLQLYLYGYTRASFGRADHRIEVEIRDLQGRPIHQGVWSRGFRTAGRFVPGAPSTHFQTWNIDVSAFDLSRAASLWIRVSES